MKSCFERQEKFLITKKRHRSLSHEKVQTCVLKPKREIFVIKNDNEIKNGKIIKSSKKIAMSFAYELLSCENHTILLKKVNLRGKENNRVNI
jgi:hypothetical protein